MGGGGVYIYIYVLFFFLGNSLLFYNMVDEALDHIEVFLDIKDLNFTRNILQCILKITMFIKKDIIGNYPLIVEKLI